ncbi:E3 ubiquitin-protein ligase MARCHF5 [Drosophila biarmipes]|uniref:E3 ubiquitin-protein ligase MARCHF5 n=1 Tax=Drosophila biarmipes TaxID=125945 RepID=UPI0007E7A3D6|nr:E3 ubiquitin-protein ligase MARCHF5 [Drosophila biarmipes]
MSEMADKMKVPQPSVGEEPTPPADGTPMEERSSTTLLLEGDPVEPNRCCWICLATDEDERLPWVNPCLCPGTTKWVHQHCLLHWIDEKTLEGTGEQDVSCPQCQTKYVVYPTLGKFAVVLKMIDILISWYLSPFLAVIFMAVSVYWLSITYGAVTFLQIAGRDRGMSIFQSGDPSIIWILVVLPLIPVGLILCRLIPWEDALLRLFRSCGSLLRNLPFMKHNREFEEQNNSVFIPLPDPISRERIICGAILLPTISYLVGNLFFHSVDNALRRTLLGCFTFVTVKGILKMYLKHQQYVRCSKRYVLNYTEKEAGQDQPDG